ncbi:MAG: DoxX family protein [Pseudomonadota bacterium]
MNAITSLYGRIVELLSGKFFESIGLLGIRIALAGVFWRSYKTKVVEGSWLQIDETQYLIFENEFTGLPLSSSLAVPLTVYAEFLFPLLLFVGLFTRFSAAALMVMALVIQIFVFPTQVHFWGWAMGIIAMAAILVSRGGGMFSLDRLFDRAFGAKAA